MSRYSLTIVTDSISEHEPLGALTDDKSLLIRSLGFDSPIALKFFMKQWKIDKAIRPDIILFRDDLDRSYIFDHASQVMELDGEHIWWGILALAYSETEKNAWLKIGCKFYEAAANIDGLSDFFRSMQASKIANELIYPMDE